MEKYNISKTPASTENLCKDKYVESFIDKWEYASVVGIMMYLSKKLIHDISFVVNQSVRLTHCPKKLHAIRVKHLIRYLQDTKTMGMLIEPSKKHQVDYCVDADFANLFGVEKQSRSNVC